MRSVLSRIAGASWIVVATLTFAPVAFAQQSADPLKDLPLTEVPAASGSTLAVFWSGDGGWADLAQSVSKELAANNVAVIGVNSRGWLQSATRSPDDVARDTERILREYLTRWSRSRIVLIGYSRGAGFVPFVVNRLPEDLRKRVELVALLGAEHSASFEFHLMDLVRNNVRKTDLPVMPEIQRSGDQRYFCLYGTTEDDTICPSLDPAKTRIVSRVGDHHFDRNFPAIARDILGAIPTR